MKLRIILLAATLFIVGTDAFVIAGVLDEMASAANVTLPMAGQLITMFAIAYAVSSPVLASVLGNVDRKALLVGSLLVFAIGNFIVAMSSDFMALSVGRVVSALGAASVTPGAMMVTAMIAPPEHRGKYLSYVVSGITLATVVGVPLGTFASTIFGYQWIFMIIGILGVVMSLALAKAFASVTPPPKVSFRQRIMSIGIEGVAPTLLVTVIVFLAAFTVYSYMSVYFGASIGAGQEELSWILFSFGLGGAIGNIIGGRLTDKVGSKGTVMLSLLGLSGAFALISVLGKSLAVVVALTFAWGIAGWLLAPAQQHRLMMLGGERAQVLIALNASSMYLGIGLSGMVGAMVIGQLGTPALTWVGSGCALVGALLAGATYVGSRQSAKSTAEEAA